MISGLVLKYLNGECFVIRRGYETTLHVSSSFCLTVPYEELGCLAQVKSQIDSLWPERNYSRGRIYKILTNPIYIGKIRHKTDIYEGLHSAIIDVAQFNRVQEQLKLKSAIKRGTHPTRGLSACLIGKIYDETGDRLTPSNTKRKGRVHRYYYSNRLTIKGADPTGWRIKAETLETALSSMVKSNLMQAFQATDIEDGLTAHELTQYITCIETLKSQAALKVRRMRTRIGLLAQL